MLKFSIAALCVAFSFAPAFAAVPVEGAADAVDAPGCCLLEAGHPVDLEILDALNSWEFKRGDGVRLRVARPVLVNGHELIPAGTPVRGEVVHAAAARGGGAPGELLLAARTLELEGRDIRLRGLKLGGTGDDNSGMALGVSFAAGPFAMFIRGTEIEIPPGTRVHARLAEAVTVVPRDLLSEPSVHTEPELP
jgi:hypothetical protein